MHQAPEGVHRGSIRRKHETIFCSATSSAPRNRALVLQSASADMSRPWVQVVCVTVSC